MTMVGVDKSVCRLPLDTNTTDHIQLSSLPSCPKPEDPASLQYCTAQRDAEEVPLSRPIVAFRKLKRASTKVVLPPLDEPHLFLLSRPRCSPSSRKFLRTVVLPGKPQTTVFPGKLRKHWTTGGHLYPARSTATRKGRSQAESAARRAVILPRCSRQMAP